MKTQSCMNLPTNLVVRLTRPLLSVLILFSLILGNGSLLAQELPGLGNNSGNNSDPTDPQPGPPNNASPFPSDFFDRLGDSIGDEWDEAGQKISASIFESLTHRELFKTELIGDLSASVKVQRKVYNNQDIIDSWTVIDIMKIPLYLPIPIINESIGFGDGVFAVGLGLSFGGEAYHIRQVSPQSWRNLKSVKSIRKQLEEAQEESGDLSKDLAKKKAKDIKDASGLEKDATIEEAQEVDGEEEGLSRFIFWRGQDPRIKARYNKIWNLLTHPLGIPLSAKRMDKYPVGDVASYGLEGAVQLGLSAGWSDFEILGNSFTRTKAGLGVTTYLKGDFRLSLWKESQDFAQVKLTRALNTGTSVNIGHLSIDQEILEGFIVLDKKILSIREEFIPFSFQINRNKAQQFDIGYRYDLRIPQARAAYEKAVLGRFHKSYVLSQVEGSGVEETFTRTSESRSRSKNYKMKLSLLFEKANSSSRKKTWAKITMDNEEHKLYSASHINFRAYDTLWGRSEAKRHQFVTTFNERLNRNDPTTGLGMRIQGRIEDSDTTGKELMAYYQEVETAVAKPNLFPRPPKYLPPMDCDVLRSQLPDISQENCEEQGEERKKRFANYGRTSFYYQLELTLEHLKHIQSRDKKEVWRALEVAFNMVPGKWSSGIKRTWSLIKNSYATLLNIPLALVDINLTPGGRLIVAHRFYRAWKDIKKLGNDPEALVSAFSKLYRTMHYSPELVQATRLLAGPKEVSFNLTAKSDQIFGQVNEGGTTFNSTTPIADEASRRIGFDQIGPRLTADKTAQISNLKFEKVDRDNAKISFELSEEPNMLYLRIDRAPGWGRYKNLLRLIIRNNGEFKKGKNEISVSVEDTEGYLGKLKKAIFNGKHSNFMMAFSKVDDQFGTVASSRFKMPKPDEDDDTEKEMFEAGNIEEILNDN